VLKITYHYKMVGEHDLPVTLQVAKGKQLVLVLRGSTLEESEPRLTLPSAEYALADMQIGQEFPPEQVVELRNSGNSELEYDVDLGPVQELNADNYGFDIFTFLNPRGVIPANGTTLLRLKHTPCRTASTSCRYASRTRAATAARRAGTRPCCCGRTGTTRDRARRSRSSRRGA